MSTYIYYCYIIRICEYMLIIPNTYFCISLKKKGFFCFKINFFRDRKHSDVSKKISQFSGFAVDDEREREREKAAEEEAKLRKESFDRVRKGFAEGNSEGKCYFLYFNNKKTWTITEARKKNQKYE